MKLRLTFLLSLCASALLLLTACEKRGLTPGQGYIQVPGGRVWYRIVGSGTATPLLLLHGGPGAPSYYLKPLAALSDERPVIFYDQLGAGHSDQPTDTTLWRIERFVKELATVRETLGLKKVHLFGHSWGTMLATDYMLTHPAGVRSLILASAVVSIPRYIQGADSLLQTLPDSVQKVIAKHERESTFDSPEYQSATMLFYQRFLARRQPWSADIDSTFAQFNEALYGYMQGPSEFTITGTIKDYDRTSRLHEISIPMLFTVGQYDEVVPSTVQYYHSLVPGSKLAIIENSGHLTMQDEPDKYIQVVRDFLREVEKK